MMSPAERDGGNHTDSRARRAMFMAIPRCYRFDIEFDSTFPQGFLLIGDIAPDNEYRTREDKATSRPVRQKIDQMTGQRQWKATVTDPDEPTAKRASFEITLIAEVQPVPTTIEVLPGIRPLTLDGLTAKPRVAGNGEFKYHSYVYRATGFSATASAARTRPSPSIKPHGVAGSGEQPGKAA
jgi:hypothetical protein